MSDLATLAREDATTWIVDPAECDFYAHDVFARGPQPAAVFRPDSLDALIAGVRHAASAGLVLVPRGGGMSYTAGYLPPEAGAVVVDLGRMDAIVAIDDVDMTVTVEAGCTWAALYAALHPRGLRVPVWGTLSGASASVGGGMSQNGLFWGAGRGTIVGQALAFKVVLADGEVVDTNAGCLRPYGPDLTGLFGADAGAFGIKAQVTLPLIVEAGGLAFGSFAFDAPAQFCAAASAVARTGLASESFGFDPFLQAQRMKRESLASDARALVGMMRAQGGFWRAVKEGAKVVSAGRSFLDDAAFSMHFIAEGFDTAQADDAMARITAICVTHGGRAVENTIPKVLRANPFPPVNSMLGPNGERWVPVHGIVPHSQAPASILAITALFEDHADEMERLSVGAGYMFLTVATTGFLIEPVFYWPGSWSELHRRSVEPAHLARLHEAEHDDAALALVETLRRRVITIMTAHGAMHFQIGRTYPLRTAHDAPGWEMLATVKRAVDPDQRMNPGALGL